MPSLIIVGTQFGDEGKGKIVDYLAENASAVVRFQGGNNAGHTVKVGPKTYKFHLLPSGIVKKKKCFLSPGVVIDPIVLLQELKALKGAGKNVVIDPRCTVIMPYHVELDILFEKHKGKKKIGTTNKGIGPAYGDKVSRQGIRIEDLLDKKMLSEKLNILYPIRKKMIEDLFGGKMKYSNNKLLNDYLKLGKLLKPMVKDTSFELSELLKKKKLVIFEGAQGAFLDNSFGTYPYVTSSHTLSSNAFTGSGVTCIKNTKVIGIAKAYTTRVGEGNFVSEIKGELGDYIRKIGHEFGTTTGRPRRIGWLDLVLLRTSKRLNGLDEIALTKLDTLSGLKEIKICIAYKIRNKKVNEVPAFTKDLMSAHPVYKTMKGFTLNGKEKKFGQLPKDAKEFVLFIEKELKIKISMIGTGPERDELIRK